MEYCMEYNVATPETWPLSFLANVIQQQELQDSQLTSY